jgi:ethanolamine ammonia-lyase small subunit
MSAPADPRGGPPSGPPSGSWAALRAATPARIGQRRAGEALALSEVLAFQLAHARARDAVHAPLDIEALRAALGAEGAGVVTVQSAAPDRQSYLRRPDWGRRLSEASAARIEPAPSDLALVIADGLSATAVQASAAPLALALKGSAQACGLTVAPLIIATQARVALGDAIAAALKARAVVVLIGERPGLSAVDSLGAYVTHAPIPGVSTDADRNCVSNIRPGGLSVEEATGRLIWLITEARRRGASGVALKDESGLVEALPAGRGGEG